MVAAEDIKAEADLLLLIGRYPKRDECNAQNRPSTFTRLLPFPGHNGIASDQDGKAPQNPGFIDRYIGVAKHLQRRLMTIRPG